MKYLRAMTRRATIFLVLTLAVMAALIPATALAQDNDDGSDSFLLRIDGDQTIPTEDRVETAIIIDGNLVVEGEIDDFVLVIDGTIEVRNGARVEGDIVAVDSDITLRDGATVPADVHVDDSSRLIIENGADYSGETTKDVFDISADFVAAVLVFFLVFAVGWLIFAIIAAIIFAGIGAQQLRTSAGLLTMSPGGTIVATIIVFIIAIGASLVSWFWFLFAAPFVGVAVSAFQLLWFLGLLVVGTRIGAGILDRDLTHPDAGKPYGPAILGTLIMHGILIIVTAAGIFLGIASLATSGSDLDIVGPLVGIPALILGLVITVAGLYGGGGLALRAYYAWRAGNTAKTGP